MQVVFTPHADRQLDRLHREITERSGYQRRADQYIQRITDFCYKLETFPARGTARNDILPGLRMIGFEKRVTIAFVVTKDRVIIEAVSYGGQDIEAAFGERHSPED